MAYKSSLINRYTEKYFPIGNDKTDFKNRAKMGRIIKERLFEMVDSSDCMEVNSRGEIISTPDTKTLDDTVRFEK